MRRGGRARRHLAVVEPVRAIPDRIKRFAILRNDISKELMMDHRVIKGHEGRIHTGGFVAKSHLAIEYVTKLRGGPIKACCPSAPRCEHFSGEM